LNFPVAAAEAHIGSGLGFGPYGPDAVHELPVRKSLAHETGDEK
jgi:hypothetical protein